MERIQIYGTRMTNGGASREAQAEVDVWLGRDLRGRRPHKRIVTEGDSPSRPGFQSGRQGRDTTLGRTRAGRLKGRVSGETTGRRKVRAVVGVHWRKK